MARKILIIDDEDDIREVAALSLESVAGWEVIKASSGAQGLARAAEHQPDAILLDVMMPGMDGPTTFRELRKNPATARIPVLLLTPGKSTPLSDAAVLRIGDNVQQVIAPTSAHWIHLDQPELVIESIREMVAAAVAAEPVAASV